MPFGAWRRGTAVLSGNGDYDGDGKWENHFRVGSEPHLLAVAACASNDESLYPKIILSFSEVVDVPDAPPVTVTADGNAASCGVNELPSKSQPMLELRCDPPLPARAKIAVTVSPGMTAKGSMLAVDYGGGTEPRTVEVPAEVQPDTCRTWRETAVPPW